MLYGTHAASSFVGSSSALTAQTGLPLPSSTTFSAFWMRVLERSLLNVLLRFVSPCVPDTSYDQMSLMLPLTPATMRDASWPMSSWRPPPSTLRRPMSSVVESSAVRPRSPHQVLNCSSDQNGLAQLIWYPPAKVPLPRKTPGGAICDTERSSIHMNSPYTSTLSAT